MQSHRVHEALREVCEALLSITVTFPGRQADRQAQAGGQACMRKKQRAEGGGYTKKKINATRTRKA